MNWDDLRFVLEVMRAGSLLAASRTLKVDHTTVGRRIEALEARLGVRLFSRTTTGIIPTAEAERLVPEIVRAEDAILSFERAAHAHQEAIEGPVRITSGETFGARYLASRLTAVGRLHSGLTLELITGGEVLDLARREADIAVRMFRSKHQDLIVQKVGEVGYGLYAAKAYLKEHPVRGISDLKRHPILTSESGPNVVEATWVEAITKGARPAFVTNMTAALAESARHGAGIAVLPRYIGDTDDSLQHIPMPNEPRERVWITVHRDVRAAARVRVVVDHLKACFARDRGLLLGKPLRDIRVS